MVGVMTQNELQHPCLLSNMWLISVLHSSMFLHELDSGMLYGSGHSLIAFFCCNHNSCSVSYG